MDKITLRKGLTVKVGGFPFKLAEDTPVLGVRNNLNLITGPASTHYLVRADSNTEE